MGFRGTPFWFILCCLVGCTAQPGAVRIGVALEGETRTHCIEVSARGETGVSLYSNPQSIPRGSRNELVVALKETNELKRTIHVRVSRFATADCSGLYFATETKETTVIPGKITRLDFVYSDVPPTDGGTDAGMDGGCDLTKCTTPDPCHQLPAVACTGQTCIYTVQPAKTPCAFGLCNASGTCQSNVCAVLSENEACDDQKPCTSTSTCVGGTCTGVCGSPPLCKQIVKPIVCTGAGASSCQLEKANDLLSCSPSNSTDRMCLNGECLPWLAFEPLNFPSTISTVPYPTQPWNLASPDGGLCTVVISTTGDTSVQSSDGGCGVPSTITSTVNDAGVAVITMTSLTVERDVRVQFAGDRPVQLLVLGNATISGIISVATKGLGLPAGSQPAGCHSGEPGTFDRQGGGGGAFGANGGNGGESGGLGGIGNGSLSPLRGGCEGGSGYGISSRAGAGGGAIHIIVADTLRLDGTVSASGGGGRAGSTDVEGGGGGGSGGTVILEANHLDLRDGAVTANGGAGGQGGDSNSPSKSGADGPLNSRSGAPEAEDTFSAGGHGGRGGDDGNPMGGNGGNAQPPFFLKGGGGGGGSAGVVFVKGHTSCVRGNGIFSGAQPVSIICN